MTVSRRELPCAYGAFLGRFGRPTPVQEAGIPPILEGRDVLLVAPTASGKTEAYAAPLAERLLGAGRRPGGAHTIIVAPTRALANDLHRRLAPAFDALQIPFGRYTGEHKERRGGRLPAVAVTTPEALDSMLARQPAALRRTRAIVLDELHVLDGTPRGDQLRILVHRLAAIAPPGLQRVAASATVSDPEGMASRYLRQGRAVRVAGRRPIRARMWRGRQPAAVARHLERLREGGFRKILVFVRSRNDVEATSAYLSEHSVFRGAVFPHHGSLARSVRERTERRFLEAPAAVAVATFTLELGIDIGGVDYVLLCGPPASVSSLLQRIGRGSRRAGESRVGCACAGAGEELVFRVMLERAAAGDLCADPYAFRPGVLVQQALVLAGAEDHVTAERLAGVLPPGLAEAWPPEVLAAVLDRMVERGLLEAARAGRYVLSERSDAWWRYGRLHSNIDEPKELVVEDRVTGEEVARIAPAEHVPGTVIDAAGRGRRVHRTLGDRVLTDPVAGGAPATFISRPIPPVSFALARAVAARLGAGVDEMLLARAGDRWLLVHGTGTCGARMLADVVGDGPRGIPPLRISPFALLLPAAPPETLRPTRDELRAVVARRERALARVLGMGPYHDDLPAELRRAAIEAAAWVSGLAEFFRRSTVREIRGAAPPEWVQLA